MILKKIGVLVSLIILMTMGAWLIWRWHARSVDQSTSHFSISNKNQSGFTFFDLDRNTPLTKTIREELGKKLGSDALETKTTIDLIFPSRAHAIFQAHLPEVIALNKALNPLPEERFEHDTTRLVFRYARKRGLPFDKVHLLFDNSSKLPLFFSIRAKGDGTELIDKLKIKYGEPKEINWQSKAGKTFYWKQENDLLVVTLTQNRIGSPEHYLGFYFIPNIDRLIELERQQRNPKKGTEAVF